MNIENELQLEINRLAKCQANCDTAITLVKQLEEQAKLDPAAAHTLKEIEQKLSEKMADGFSLLERIEKFARDSKILSLKMKQGRRNKSLTGNHDTAVDEKSSISPVRRKCKTFV